MSLTTNGDDHMFTAEMFANRALAQMQHHFNEVSSHGFTNWTALACSAVYDDTTFFNKWFEPSQRPSTLNELHNNLVAAYQRMHDTYQINSFDVELQHRLNSLFIAKGRPDNFLA